MVFVVHLHLHLYSSVLLSPSYIRAATPELNYNIGCTHSMVSKLFTLITLWVKASSQYSIGFHTGCLILMVSSYSLPHKWKHFLHSLWKPFIILKIPFSLVFLNLFILSPIFILLRVQYHPCKPALYPAQYLHIPFATWHSEQYTGTGMWCNQSLIQILTIISLL